MPTSGAPAPQHPPLPRPPCPPSPRPPHPPAPPPAAPVLPTPLPAVLLAPALPPASAAARRAAPPHKPRIPSLHCGGPKAQLARIAPYASPSWQHLRLMHAFRGKNGKILAPCVHFRVRSGGFGCMARKSCCQGRLFASRGLRSCMARRTCQRCSTSSWQRPVVCSNGLCALSPIPGLLDAWVHPCNPGRAHRYRYHALPLACDRRTACALPAPYPHPRSACRSRYRVPSGSRPGDVAPWRYRPQPAIASRCTACVPRPAIAADPATSRPAATRVATCAVPASPRHPPHLVLPRGPRCSSGNSREMVR